MKCECELRARQWNGFGKCLFCGGAYVDARRGTGRPIIDSLVDDVRERSRIGELRYGSKLTANNGRDALRDAYDEALDLAMYLRQLLDERDSAQDGGKGEGR